VNTIYTERANHAQEYILNEMLDEYDGLICVGGDGMFAELCHGLLLRTARDEQLNIDNPHVNLIRPKLRIGIIPAGSTDAVVFGTTGLNDPVTSALQIIVGESLLIDITTVREKNKKNFSLIYLFIQVHNEHGFVRFMATMLAYGFFGDIIHQSDQWRCLGPLRYDLAGFCQFLRNTSYHSELTITLSPHDAVQICHPQTMNNGSGTSSVAPDCQQLINNSNTINKSAETVNTIVSPIMRFCSRNCGTCAEEEKNDPNKVHLPLQIKREGRYTTVNCLNMPCRCAKSKYGMSPFVHLGTTKNYPLIHSFIRVLSLGDGTFDLILVKRSWRTGFLRFLWQVANDGRSIEDLPNVERYRVSEVLIRPINTGRKQAGNWACDGELINGNEIQIRVHRQSLNLFASGIQFEERHQNENLKMKNSNSFPCFRNKKSKISQELNSSSNQYQTYM
jgi:ceramide kinase